MYAVLDSEVNTDDGGDVIATIRGGSWDKAKVIGSVERGPNNIRLRFITLAPHDERPTMSINAVALREKDAKQGVAEHIDHPSHFWTLHFSCRSIPVGWSRKCLRATCRYDHYRPRRYGNDHKH